VLNGGDGSDVYAVSGTAAGGSSTWSGFDSYADDGATGTDTLRATGGDVDIGLRAFSTATSGIEVIDASAVTGLARIYGDTSADSLDFRGTTLLGTIVIDGRGGDDRIAGSAGADSILGGSGADLLAGNRGADRLDGGSGSDVVADWSGADTLVGGTGKDRLVLAHGDGSILELWGGTQEAGKDGSTDLYTLLGSRGALAFDARIHDFETGLDRIDLSQLRNATNSTLTMGDLLISYSAGNARIGFAAGVHTVGNASVAVATLTLLNVSALTSASFALSTAQLPSGAPLIDPVLPLLAG
jgi:Ca2+-binding RTX toxin-like protein